MQKEDLDKFFEIKGSSFNYLAISIRLKSFKSLKYFAIRNANLEGDCTGKTSLMYAVKYEQLEMVKYLLKNEAELNASNGGKRTIDYAKRH